VVGIALFIGLWSLVAMASPQLPSPAKPGRRPSLVQRSRYRKGPNDQGIGWNVLMSLQRVGIGFGLAALVGFLGLHPRPVPSRTQWRRRSSACCGIAPRVAAYRVMVFKAANPAAIWVIFI
jgi:nitrate/nitrite transport system permease protein